MELRYYVEEKLSRWATQAVSYKSLELAHFAASQAKDCSHAIIWKVDLSRPSDHSIEVARYSRGKRIF